MKYFNYFLILFFSFLFFLSSSNFPAIEKLSKEDTIYNQFIKVVADGNKNISSSSRMSEDELHHALQIFSYRPKKDDDIFSIVAQLDTVGKDSIATLNRLSSIKSISNKKEILLPTLSGVFVYKKPINKFEEAVLKEFSNSIQDAVKFYLNGDEAYFFLGKRLKNSFNQLYKQQDNLGKLPFKIKRYAISSPYGIRKDPFNPRKTHFHRGVDYAIPLGTKVYSLYAGVVVYADYTRVYGYHIEIEHKNSTSTFYAHLKKGSFLVKVGQKVSAMQQIALSGNTGLSTGPHLHFGVKKNGYFIDPIGFLKRGGLK